MGRDRMPQPGTDKSAADSHDVIEVRGARENNLRNVSLDIPKRRLTVFTGVSGSGKSSLVFGTIAAESQRLINETYTAYLQAMMPNLGRPDVDELRNLSAAIIVDQERMGANSRSTVGTATDAHTMLRIVFSRLGKPHIGTSVAFSFNSTEGMCPECEGIGSARGLDMNEMYDVEKSLNEGAITIPNFHPRSQYWQTYNMSEFFDMDKKLKNFTKKEWELFLHAPAEMLKRDKFNFKYEGLLVKFNRIYAGKERDTVQPHVRAWMDRAMTFTTCNACNGTRLNQAALGCKIKGKNIAELSSMQISDLAAFLRKVTNAEVAPLLTNLLNTLDSLVEIGLGYLSLDRESGTLSGGEAQRVKMVRHLGSALSDVTYVFDEPTTGLHPHDIERMNNLLLMLRDKGNTVLVVEHKPEAIAIADHVVDLGPGAGVNGGELCYTGDLAGLRKSGTLTGDHLDHKVGLRDQVRTPKGKISVKGAKLHNLKNVSVDVPLGVLTVVTGVAGSGKSSLIHGSLGSRADVVKVDQSPIRGSKRSNPATYTGMLDSIRKAFAKANNVKDSLFSANSDGACPNCKGIGLIYTDLAMMAGVATVCEECDGKRYTPKVLGYKLNGKNIAEVLAMPIAEAAEFFADGPTKAILARLVDVGLGYLGLGQPLNTLSGGERQRLKLAINMTDKGSVYVLDEPTTGLHLADVDQLLGLLDRLVDNGNTVVVIEHHQAVMAHADWIIDMGPGAGHDGGKVVFTGTPHDLIASGDTLTAQHLRTYVKD
jgi:excinuclease UvrABC ATPase subunit